MRRERQVPVVCRRAAVAQQFLGAGVDLHRRDDTGQPARGMRQRLVDHPQRLREAGPAARLVPVIARAEIVFEKPSRRGIPRGEESAHAAPGEELDPAVERRRDVDQRGHAAQQQLAIGELGAGGARLVIGHRECLTALVESGHMHVGDAVLLADAAIKRLVMRVRMDVDEARHHHQPGAVDGAVRDPSKPLPRKSMRSPVKARSTPRR
jgi:hypothetical protein